MRLNGGVCHGDGEHHCCCDLEQDCTSEESVEREEEE